MTMKDGWSRRIIMCDPMTCVEFRVEFRRSAAKTDK
jgi:hypothetical protein